MRHIPHMVVGAPWPEDKLPLTVVQWRHLTKVLRLGKGDRITYTDGLGTVGSGVLLDKSASRSDEHRVSRPTELTVAVAPPSNKDRQRFVVEKLAELGVARLLWLDTRHGQNRLASPAKVFAWTLAATEQSRGAWLMETSHDVVGWDGLEGPLTVCHPGGSPSPGQPRTVVIGPEGGLNDDEIPEGASLWDLGPTTLRIETAAVVAVARLIS